MMLHLKKIRLISLYFIRSFLSKKYKWVSLKLIYIRTLEYSSLLLPSCFTYIIHDRWLEVLITSLPSSDVKLKIVLITNQKSSWINMMSKFLLFSRIRLVRRQFLQTFCEKIFSFFKIIVSFYPCLSKPNWPWFLGAPMTSCYTSLN